MSRPLADDPAGTGVAAGGRAGAKLPQSIRRDRFADEHAAELKAQAIALRPLLRSEAQAGERSRSMTDPVLRVLLDLKLFSMLVPRRWGGMGLSATAMMQVNREIAKGDPSVAWVVQIINGCTWIGSLTSDRLQEELFGNGVPQICSSFATSGAARPVKDGYIVNGLWTYNSGSRQSQWGQYLVTIEQPDGRITPGHFAYLPMRDVEIVDTWYCAGLQGTSSDSARVTELFVPAHRMVLAERSFSSERDVQKHAGEPSDWWPTMPLIRSTGLGLLLGTAEAALELALEAAGQRGIPTTTYKRQADAPVWQRNLGEAAASIDTARLLIESATGTFDQLALRREQADAATRARLKGQAATIVKLLTRAVDSVMFGAGSSAFLLDNPLQRFWRDINVAARHAIYNPDIGYEVFGRALLGVDPNIVMPQQI
jgi:alkylation response protein AidB-like acyl-CoA dehydrogenase